MVYLCEICNDFLKSLKNITPKEKIIIVKPDQCLSIYHKKLTDSFKS